jgi:octaprenyl-diphosphate synthase
MVMAMDTAQGSELELLNQPVDRSAVVTGRSGSRDSTAVVDSRRALKASFYGPVAGLMDELEQRLADQLRSPHGELDAVLRHGALLGGKRLRPALVLLSGAACGSVTDAHLTVSTVIEMVHLATLVHDDVLDEAAVRRHMATINARWNRDTSILLGDWLFSRAYALAATLGSTDACRMIGLAASAVCQGELRQVLHVGDVDLDEATYFDCIRGKTAELCRVSCELGGHYAAAPVTWTEGLAKYGDQLGLAFQVMDDYLDLWGSEAKVGKSLGSDVGQVKLTLPMIRLRSVLPAAQWNDVKLILRNEADADRMSRLRPYLDQSDAASYTLQMAQRLVRNACEALRVLPASSAAESLRAMAEFCVQRSF